MYAKLIIYQTNPVNESVAANGAEVAIPNRPWEQSASVEAHIQWQLIANNLTAGKLTELLVCLDELGFCNEITD